MRIVTATLFLCLQASLAGAEDLSPWFGGNGQKPFRIEAIAMEPATADPAPTNSIEPPACDIADCPKHDNTATTTEGQAGLSQN
jgi:hypothetical protein